ncbi:hypothetical protein Tco_1101749 [Tanacetum coccineum]
MLDRKELILTLDDFRTIFHLPQGTDNNHDHFVPAPKFSKMIPFYVNNLGFTLELRSTLNFKTTGLLQPWQTLCKMFPRCLTTRVTGYDQPSLRFTKIIVSHYMTTFPDISKITRDRYHNLADDVMIKRIFNSGKSKGVIGMKIPDWMITDEIKLTENYRLYAEVFGVDVPTTQSQPIEFTQGTHTEIAEGESSTLRKFTIIRLHIPSRQSTRLTLPTPIPKTDEADDLVLQDTLQVSLAKRKSHEELEAKQNVEKVKEHLMAEEIKKLVEGSENVEEYVEVANDDNQTNPGTILEPRSDKERPKVEKIVDISQPVNVIEEEEESAEGEYELKRREKGKEIEESRNTPSPTTTRSLKTHSTLISSKTEKLQELTKIDTIPSSSTPSSSSSKLSATNRLLSLLKPKPGRFKKLMRYKENMECGNFRSKISSQVNDAITNHIPSQFDSSVRSYMSGHVLHVHLTQATSTTAQEQHQLYLTMKDNPQLQHDDLPIWLALKYKFERLHMVVTLCKPFSVRPKDQDDPHDDAHLEEGGGNSAKRQKTSEHGIFVFQESSSSQDYESKPGPSTLGNQEQSDEFDFWTNSYAIDDDVLPNEKVSQELVDKFSQTIDEVKLRKVESRKEIIVPPYQPKPTPVVQSCQRDPKAHALPLVNQDLLYLKKGNSGPEKIVLSLHKFPAVIFLDDDIEERTSRWVKRCVKKFNPYA